MIVASGRRADDLAELVSSLPGDGHRVAVADLALEGAAERLVREAGEVDVLVANAALSGGGRLERFSQEELGSALRVNFEAPIRMAWALLPELLERGEGHLVFVSSLQGKVALARSSVYSATKFGLRGFALSLRDDLHGTGVGSSVVLPGFIRDAGMFADSGQRAPAGLGTSSPGAGGRGRDPRDRAQPRRGGGRAVAPEPRRRGRAPPPAAGLAAHPAQLGQGRRPRRRGPGREALSGPSPGRDRRTGILRGQTQR